MAMTPAERKRLQRERDREKALEEERRRASQDVSYPYLKRKFSELAETNGGFTDFEVPLWTAGIEAPGFFDERGPMDFVLEDAMQGVESPFEGVEGAIGRAEVVIDCLIDAAAELASIVNRYKRQEIEARLSELESSTEKDRGEAMKEAVRLNKMLDQLNKQVRRSFPQWKVTGV